jgi:hypothetical protein
MPAAPFGDPVVRATSLLMFAVTALLCVSIARHRNVRFPVLAGTLLVVQPLAGRLAFAALPYTVFSLVLAIAFWLRATGRHRAAALTASLLPLARLDGLVAAAAWAAVAARERRWRDVPLFGAGMVGWAAVGALVHGDLLWIVDANPYGVTSSRYGSAGWNYVLHAFPIAAGPVVGGLVIAALAVRHRDRDNGDNRADRSLTVAVAASLVGFYVLTWGLGWFQTGSVPVYLVTASVPFALIAHSVVVALATPRARLRLAGVAAAAALCGLAVVDQSRLVDLAVALVAGGAIAVIAYRARPVELRLIAVTGTVAISLLVGLALTDPLPLGGGAVATKRLVTAIGPRADDVLAWTHPAFGWFADRTQDDRFRRFQDAPVGSYVVWDSEYGPALIPRRRLERLGYVVVQTEDAGGERVGLWQRAGRARR